MTRIALQFFGVQVHRAGALIIDDASVHTDGFILAQNLAESEAVPRRPNALIGFIL